jgi:hypothetical protein
MKPALIFLLLFISACQAHDDYLLRISDNVSGDLGYVNLKGDTVIRPGKYAYCFTDTFKNYAIVSKSGLGMIGINRKEKILYKVFVFDNGPDEISDGHFRIIKNNKIGYADSLGNIVIQPTYDCAQPYEKGVALVSNNCRVVLSDEEHWHWESDNWFYIDKTGKRVK